MKMKFRYLVNSAMLWTALALGSCADFLDREPYSEPVDESYWNSEEDVEAAVAGGYGLLRAALANHSAYYAYGDIAGIIGVLNAEKPQKAKACIVWGALVAVLSVAGKILGVAGGGDFNAFSLVLGLVLPVLYIIGAVKNMQSANSVG